MKNYTEQHRTELFEPEDEERYLLRSTPEIIRVLRDLARKPDIITAYFNGGDHYLLTTILGVLPDREMVVLDYGADETLNEAAVKAEHLECVARHEHVSVRFTCTKVQRARYQGNPVLAAPLPESVYRPQRREFFRIQTPLYNPIMLRITPPDGEPLELPVVDLSGGGLGIHDQAHQLEIPPGTLLAGCQLELPGFGHLVFDLQVRNHTKVRLNDGSEITRVGCQFKGLSIDANALLQRFIHKLQLETKR